MTTAEDPPKSDADDVEVERKLLATARRHFREALLALDRLGKAIDRRASGRVKKAEEKG